MRLLVCGGRHFRDSSLLAAALNQLDAEHCIDLIIHGAAPGADKMADVWARRHGVPVWPFPADWERLGNAAGPIRNEQMLTEAAPTHVLSFPGGAGTADMVRRARRAGLEVIEVNS